MPSDAHAQEGNPFEAILAESGRRRTEAWGPAVAENAPKRLGIVGGGLMGTSIAAAAVDAGIDVVLVDSDAKARRAAAGRVADELREGYGHGPDSAERAVSKMAVSDSLEPLAECDLVIESIAEAAVPKKRLFEELSKRVSTETILATNTSTIPLGQMVESVANPERFCGIHFCHPVAKRRFIEIIAPMTASKATIATALGLAERLDRFTVVVGDGAGFIVNRMLAPYLTAAFELLLDGIPPDRIDAVALAHGMDKGPLELADEIGIDVLLDGALVLRDAFPNRFAGSMVPIALVKAKRLGVKRGAGVYRYDEKGARQVDATLDAILEFYGRDRPTRSLTDEDIRQFLLGSLPTEATAIVDDGIAAWRGDAAIACVLGLGFPEDAETR